MAAHELHVVTGAFRYSGRHIAERLLAAGHRVRTLTNHRRDALAGEVEVRPLDFADRAGLVSSLRGAGVLYNTYGVRFDHARFTHASAVDNTLALFEAARAAGVRRVVHVSITNPDEGSSLGEILGVRRPIISVPPWLGWTVGAILGRIVGDVVITRDEIAGLMSDLLCVDAEPAGTTRLTQWAGQHRETLGRRYANELSRR